LPKRVGKIFGEHRQAYEESGFGRAVAANDRIPQDLQALASSSESFGRRRVFDGLSSLEKETRVHGHAETPTTRQKPN
jgi:hypothetical protein